MARLAKRLEIILVVKQATIAAMRNDVVNISCHCDNSSLEALRTMGMLSNESVPKLSPSIVIATIGRCSFGLQPPRLSSFRSQLVLLLASLFVSLAVLLTERHCTSASGISAELEEWHDIGLENKKGRALRLSPDLVRLPVQSQELVSAVGLDQHQGTAGTLLCLSYADITVEKTKAR